MDVLNAGNYNITLDSNTLFKTYGNQDIILPPISSVRVYSTGTVWVQASPVCYTGGSDTFLQSWSNLVAAGTSGTFSNITSVVLTPGTWKLNMLVECSANGATVTEGIMAISAYSGDTTTDHSYGNNRTSFSVPTSTNFSGGCIPTYLKTVTVPTTMYAKTRLSYTGATPQVVARLTAEIA
jgi:hypothetical protein